VKEFLKEIFGFKKLIWKS